MSDSLSRRERERLVRRDEMLSAARSVFAEKGFSRATLDEIAHRAEFGKGTIYNYFEGGKEELLLSILAQLYDGTATICDAVFSPERLDSEPIRDLFREFLVRIFDYFTEHREVFIIHLKEAHGMLFAENKELASAIADKRDKVVELLMQPLQYGMRTGQLRSLPSRDVSHLLFGNIKGMQMQRCLFSAGAETANHQDPGQPASSEKQADFLLSILFDGLLDSTASADVNGVGNHDTANGAANAETSAQRTSEQ